MASSYTGLGTELMTTGENAGTWGSTTNTNLQIIEQISGGYTAQDIAGSADTTTLSVSDGSTGAVLAHRVIEFTGTITGNQIVTIPLDVQTFYIMKNNTSGAYTVQFKYVSGSGSSVTWAATDKGTKLIYATADHATNPNLVDSNIGGVGSYDLDGNELTLDADSDTSITASTDDQIDIEIAGADDFTFTANAFNVLTGSHATFADSANAKFGTGNDMLVYHDGSNSYITNAQGALKIATETSGIAVTIGHTTSETTIADNLTVTGTLTGTLATAAQGSVTSLGTLTALTVDDVAVNGKVVTMTGSASDTAVLTAGTNGTLSIVTTDAAAAAANIQITADGTVDIDSAGVLTLDSGAAINIEPAAGSAILLDGTISVDAGVVTGATSITSTAFVGDITGDVTGNTSGTAATVTTAAQTNITSLGTLTTLTVDNVNINGTTIGHTSDTDLLTFASASLTALGTITVGVDDTGHDVKFFGASAGAYLEWDESADQLRIMGASADATTSTGKLLLATSLTDINANDVIGKIEFQAPHEAGGTDAITVAASIQAIAQGTFSASVNATDLVFYTGHSEANTEKFRFTSQGEIGVGGANYGTDGQVLTSGGAGAAPAWEDASSSAADDISTGDGAVNIVTSSGAVLLDSQASTTTVDGHTGVTVQSTSSGDITLDSVADIVVDAAGGNVEFKDAGTLQLTLDMDGTAGEQIIQLGVNSDDLVFKQYDGTEVFRMEDGAYLNVSNTTASSSATTGSAIFGGGIGVAADAFVGDDLTLISDSAVLGFGADTDTTLTHTDGTGLTLNGTNKLCFYDTALSINSSTDGQLDLIADTEIQIAATTVDVNGILDVSGVLVAGGQISASDGTAGAPSISNTGDLNTGLLFSAADTMQFSSGGTAQFTMADGAITPVTDNDIDLGTVSLQFKNAYVNGTMFADALGFGTVVMTLPTADGSADQILTTNGSGALAFVDNSGGTDWQAVKTGNFTASAGQGVFVNTTSAAITITLPAGSIGNEVSIIDYAGTFDSNNCTIAANGSEKIHGSTDDLTVATERAAFTLVFTDSTQGWLLKDK